MVTVAATASFAPTVLSVLRSTPGLVERAKDGDRQAFLGLFEAHSGRVYALGLSVLKDVTRAEDLTRETFMEAFGSLHLISDDAAFAARLYRGAAKCAIARCGSTRLKAPGIRQDSAGIEV